MISESSYKKPQIAIIGWGNVATHLATAFQDKAEIYMVDSRKPENFPAEIDTALICVKDDVIAEVASKISGKAKIVAHTSGSVDIKALEGSASHTGVLYPLQTFTKDIALDYSEIPFFIEGSDNYALEKLTGLASLISKKIKTCDSEKRRHLHLASVFACNFSNLLLIKANEILSQTGFEKEDILPLVRMTLKKFEESDPLLAQTGPAKRKDFKVMQRHLEMLEKDPDKQKIYEILSKSIMNLNR